jgi:hypothetical protein
VPPFSTIASWVHEHHLVGYLAVEAHLVGAADHRHAFPNQPGHYLQHFLDHLRVERRGRLVE